MKLEESKEFMLAQSIENEINSFSFDGKRFAESVKRFHPTLQQKFYRIMRTCITELAKSDRPIDDRNKASFEECRKIDKFLEKEGRGIPTI